MLNYTEYQTEQWCQLLEANNYVPLFWRLLLDSDSLLQYKDKFIGAYYHTYEGFEELSLTQEVLKRNIGVAETYLQAHNTDILPLFHSFAQYILSLSKKGSIDIYMLQMADFTTPQEYMENLLSDVQKIEKNQAIAEIESAKKRDFLNLVGMDYSCCEAYAFSKFSQEYAKDLQDTSIILTNEKHGYRKNQNKEWKRERIRKWVEILFMGITGAALSIGLPFVMFEEGVSWIAIGGFIVGILCILYAYFIYKEVI